MQADIAGRVAQAMNVALAGGTRVYLAEVPTHHPAAYDAYLRGKEIVKTDPVDLRRRLRYFRQAVALDSSFALAWVERSRVAAILFSNGVPDPALASEAKMSAERAIALAPQQGTGYGALATYRNLVEQDPVGALEAAKRAQSLSPGDPELLRPLAIAERQQGRVDESLRHMRAAAERDPRNATTVHLLADALLWARHYDEARAAADRALALAPDVSEMIEGRAMISLARGDLADARRVLAAVPPSVDRNVLAAAVSMYYDLPWLLDDGEQRRLLALGPDTFDGDRMSWAWALAQTYALRGDVARTRAFAESTVVAVDEQLRSAPNDAQRHLVRGLALAALGRAADAVAAGNRGFALQRQRWTATNGPYAQHQLARIYMMVGDRAKAMDLLEPLLADAVLSVAGLAQDRSDVRAVEGRRAVRAARRVGAAGRSRGSPAERLVRFALCQRASNLQQVMPRMPHRVVLEHELAGARPVRVERERGGRVELLVAERAHGGGRGGAVLLQQVQRFLLRHAVEAPRVVRVHLVHLGPGDALDRFASRQLLREADLDRIHRSDVMHDHADLPVVVGNAQLPLLVGERSREIGELAHALLEPLREDFGSVAQCQPRGSGEWLRSARPSVAWRRQVRQRDIGDA